MAEMTRQKFAGSSTCLLYTSFHVQDNGQGRLCGIVKVFDHQLPGPGALGPGAVSYTHLSYACDWDNPGLQVGRREMKIYGIYVALDLTEKVIWDARHCGCNCVLTHHPLLFSPLRRVAEDTVPGRLALTLAEEKMACVSMHTNFDAAPGCMADLAADRLGLRDSVYLEPVADGGIGKVGNLPEPVSLEAFCQQVKTAFRLPAVTLYDGGPEGRTISRVGILRGSGKGEIPLALSLIHISSSTPA